MLRWSAPAERVRRRRADLPVRSVSMMTSPQITLTQDAAAIDQRPCPLCQAQMVLACIRPAGLGIDLRTFECIGCNYLERVRVQTVRRLGFAGRIYRDHE